jgi:hypothetical protein
MVTDFIEVQDLTTADVASRKVAWDPESNELEFSSTEARVIVTEQSPGSLVYDDM